MEIKARVAGYRDELVSRLGRLVAINSAEGEHTEDAPFGEGPKKALVTALDMLQKDGFRTVNLDNYAGYAEIGEGDRVIGIVGHLDVVPARMEDGWNSDPFTMVEKDGILYGRGVSDDKGAVAASMIALKVLVDSGVKLNKRIRLIMGTNEETGSRGLAYYVRYEGSVDYGFTPDGDFPAIHGEKGIMSGTIQSRSTNLIDIKGGTAHNIVCSSCYAVVRKNSYSTKKLDDYFNNLSIPYTVEDQGDDTVKITVKGKAAHASTPQKGINAISHLLVGLQSAGFQDPFTRFYCSRIGTATDGSGLNGACSDEYGALTLNNGVISMKDGVVTGSIDIRFPVTMTGRQVIKQMDGRLENEDGAVKLETDAEPLFFPVDSPLVACLSSAYEEVTGDHEHKPMVIGGGTYAKGIDNTIAFGCAFPDKDYHIHDANEWVTVDELLLQAEIYVRGIEKLLEL